MFCTRVTNTHRHYVYGIITSADGESRKMKQAYEIGPGHFFFAAETRIFFHPSSRTKDR